MADKYRWQTTRSFIFWSMEDPVVCPGLPPYAQFAFCRHRQTPPEPFFTGPEEGVGDSENSESSRLFMVPLCWVAVGERPMHHAALAVVETSP